MHELTIRDTKKDLIKRLISFELTKHLAEKVVHNTKPLIVVNPENNLPCTSSFRDPVDFAPSHGFFIMLELGMITEASAKRAINGLLQEKNIPDEFLNREMADYVSKEFYSDKRTLELMSVEPSNLLNAVYYECMEIIYNNESGATNALMFEEEIMAETSNYCELVTEVQNEIMKLSFLGQFILEQEGYDITTYYCGSFSTEINEVHDNYFDFQSLADREKHDYSHTHINPTRGGGFSCMN